MTAPHFHNTAEARAAIKKIEHNAQQGNGAPSGIAGGSAGVDPHITPGVDSRSKGDDWVANRGITSSQG